MCNMRSPCSAFFTCSSHILGWIKKNTYVVHLKKILLLPYWTIHLAVAKISSVDRSIHSPPVFNSFLLPHWLMARVDGDCFSPAISWHHSCIFTMMELSFCSLFNGTCLFISSLTLLAQTNFGATLVGGEHWSSWRRSSRNETHLHALQKNITDCSPRWIVHAPLQRCRSLFFLQQRVQESVGLSHCSKKGFWQAPADLDVALSGKLESQASVCSRASSLFITIPNSRSFLTPTDTENGGFSDWQGTASSW